MTFITLLFLFAIVQGKTVEKGSAFNLFDLPDGSKVFSADEFLRSTVLNVSNNSHFLL